MFKYLGSVLDESGTNIAECHRKVASGKNDAVGIRSLVNASVCEGATLGNDRGYSVVWQ